MTPEAEALIAQAKELDAKATPGEWTCETHDGWAHPYVSVAIPADRPTLDNKLDTIRIGDLSCTVGKVEREIDNARFIAFSRTAIPAFARLLREAEAGIERLRRERDELRGALLDAALRAECTDEDDFRCDLEDRLSEIAENARAALSAKPQEGQDNG